MPQLPQNILLNFNNRVVQDNALFKINSKYLPYPILSDEPEYCIVAMEPIVRENNLNMIENDIANGFLNFLKTPQDFILHYCLYTFLCEGGFNYHITDISKGVMTREDADIQREIRYQNWLHLLQQELVHFGNPNIIALGRAPERVLVDVGINVRLEILHIGLQNSRHFSTYYNDHQNDGLPHNLHLLLKEFVSQILDYNNYTIGMKNRILNNLFIAELSPWHKGMYLYYRDQFNDLGT